MSKTNFLSFFLLSIFLGCANTYKLEKKSELNFKESYYKNWSSGIKEGGAGFSIYLFLDNSVNDKNIVVEGIYFKGKFTNLKDQGKGKFQGFIKESDSKKTNELEIPFKLDNNEAVVSYSAEGKLKYVKIVLAKKSTMDFPM